MLEKPKQEREKVAEYQNNQPTNQPSQPNSSRAAGSGGGRMHTAVGKCDCRCSLVESELLPPHCLFSFCMTFPTVQFSPSLSRSPIRNNKSFELACSCITGLLVKCLWLSSLLLYTHIACDKEGRKRRLSLCTGVQVYFTTVRRL